jgi:hypothetical protein
MVNDRVFGVGKAVLNSSSVGADLVNNILVDFSTALDGTAGTESNNLDTLTAAQLKFVDRSSQDYHLEASSPAIDAGTDPGLGHGFDLNPGWQCGQYERRVRVGILTSVLAAADNLQYDNQASNGACSPRSGTISRFPHA